MVCSDGILFASDSLISGPTKVTLPHLKHFYWRGLEILYAGDLAYIQKLQALPDKGYPYGEVTSFQQLLWDFPPDKSDNVEFLVLDRDWSIHTVDRWGAAVEATEFAVIGSEIGMGCMYMVEKRIRTIHQAKRVAAKVMRAVAKIDSNVAEPFRYKEMFWQ
jgi:hypothetical protein